MTRLPEFRQLIDRLHDVDVATAHHLQEASDHAAKAETYGAERRALRGRLFREFAFNPDELPAALPEVADAS